MNQKKGPVGKGAHIVGEGDCMESIAVKHGFFWETIWNYGENDELRQERGDPQCLLPGDRISIPEKASKEESIANEKRHRFRRKGVPSVLKIYVKQFGEAKANQPYIADIDGDVREGTTDSGGLVREPIPPGARHCKLTVGEGEESMILELDLGGLDPVSEISGVQKRLANLGYKCPLTNELDEETRNALKIFQKKQSLDTTGEPDEKTRKALMNLHQG